MMALVHQLLKKMNPNHAITFVTIHLSSLVQAQHASKVALLIYLDLATLNLRPLRSTLS